MDIPLSLSYRGSLRPSDAIFYCKSPDSDIKLPVTIVKRIANSSSSAFSEGQRDQSIKDISSYHLGRTQLHPTLYCHVPYEAKWLYCKFSLKFLFESRKPHAHDDLKVSKYLQRFAKSYKDRNGYHELAKRYAKNILRGQWLWKNIESDWPITLTIKRRGNLLIKVKNIQCLQWSDGWEDYQDELDELIDLIDTALSSTGVITLSIKAKIRAEKLQEVLPSQLVHSEAERRAGKEPTVAETSLNSEQMTVCFTKYKVGAGIQLIDDWIDTEDPIRVSEYGAVHGLHIALRTPRNKQDVYSLLPKVPFYIRFLRYNKLGEDEISNKIHYLMSMLIKGGVFNRKSDKA
ncbi:type I-F CRISPR-associated protein Csy3 [Parashewanella curva]|uniref:Type I-F CRISPR-associated protein Csy3 n=1 Tax=Parashewanella curva TaxID=2338552 RepID=A0A3L8Q2D0_9GAMM|nr:type I-F CRISPR-associated protein Csy3 [Parashewanella curva]RLV60492.1 type I-F CRISPR-associated protein Csy3 [Parashewanella curva]